MPPTSWPGATANAPGVRRADDAGEVGRRVTGRLGFGRRSEMVAPGPPPRPPRPPPSAADAGGELLQSAAEQLLESCRGRADVIVARRQAEDTELPAIVGLIAADRLELAFAALILIALHGDERARQRFAVLVAGRGR